MDEVTEEIYERYFVFAVIWSFGGTLSNENQEPFSEWWRKTFEDRISWPFTGTVCIHLILLILKHTHPLNSKIFINTV